MRFLNNRYTWFDHHSGHSRGLGNLNQRVLNAILFSDSIWKMLAMEYCVPHQHKYACSTMSSETLSGSCGSRNNRIRTVRLVRPSNGPLPPPNLSCRHGPSLGFSIRGGREHGTGFFVSYVESGSEANNQGLRVRIYLFY